MSDQSAVIRLVGAAKVAAVGGGQEARGMVFADVARDKADEFLAKKNYRGASVFYDFASKGYARAKEGAEPAEKNYDTARAELKKAVDILCEYK